MDHRYNSEEILTIRLDKWLWAARFFKTRTAATKAINSGRVLWCENRVKPAKLVQKGDRLSVTRGIYQYLITIERIENRRKPASEAKTMYTESEDSIRKREELASQEKAERLSNPSFNRFRRPNKKERRQIIKLIRSE